MLCSSPITLFCKDRVLFLLIHLTGVLRHLFKFFFILSSLASLFNRSVVRICSSLLVVYLVSTRVVSILSCPLCSSLIALQPPRLTWCSLFLFSIGVLSISFISVVFFLSICSTFQGFLVSLVCQRSNLVLPLLFLFRFPSGAILDLGTRSSRSGGVL